MVVHKKKKRAEISLLDNNLSLIDYSFRISLYLHSLQYNSNLKPTDFHF